MFSLACEARTTVPGPPVEADAGEPSADATESDAAAADAEPIDASSGAPPTAVLSADVLEGAAPLLVRFDGSGSSDPDGDLSRLVWDFGDGAGAEGANVEHSFSAPGTYTVTLTAHDAQGAFGQATASVRVSLAACPTFARGVSAGLLGSNFPMLLEEVSGLVASRRQPEVLWVHNDSGDRAYVYAIDDHGAVRAGYELAGAQAVDWEDIALGPGPQAGTDYLYVGDIGDNDGVSDIAPVYRFAEPTNVPAPSAQPPLIRVRSVETIVLAYGGRRAFNAETMMIDPRTGDLFVVTKSDTGRSLVFRAPAPIAAGAQITMEELGTIDLQGEATGGDISPSGEIVIRTYDAARVWRRPEGMSVIDALRQPACLVRIAREEQGEAISFTHDGGALWTTSEGTSALLYRYARQ